MDMKLDETLCRKFPLLYADRNAPMQSTCMCWGFDCGDGWYNIVHDLSVKLESIIRELAEKQTQCECSHERTEHSRGRGVCGAMLDFREIHEPCTCEKYVPLLPRAAQVKEKFGGLRFYMTAETDEMHEHISKAMELSSVTCETCGAPGEYRGDLGWVQTLCESHYQSLISRPGYRSRSTQAPKPKDL